MLKTSTGFISYAHIRQVEWKGKVQIAGSDETWWGYDVMLEGSARQRMIAKTEELARNDMDELVRKMDSAGY